jgi:hypothetical protein
MADPRGRAWTVLVHGKPASSPGFPIESPRHHMRLDRGFKGHDQTLELVERQAGQIQEFHWAGLQGQ